MNSAQALHKFWSGFGWKAYDDSTVPAEDFNPEIPRITYNEAFAEFLYPVFMTASLWDRSYSWSTVIEKAQEIYRYIGLGGRLVAFDGGKIWIKRGNPFYQRMADEDDTVRRVLLNIEAEYFISE